MADVDEAPPTEGAAQNPSAAQHQATGGLFHHIMGALGGGNEDHFSVSQDGQMQNNPTPETPGKWARNLLAGALTGLAAGAQTHRPGASALAGLGAGAQAGMQQVQQQQAQGRQQATEDYNRQQQAILEKAQRAHLSLESARYNLENERMGVEQQEHQAQNYNQLEALVKSNPANQLLGVFKDFNEFLEASPQLHEQVAKLMAHGQLQTFRMPDGIHAYAISPNADTDKLEKDTPLNHQVGWDKDPKTGKMTPRYAQDMIPAGTKVEDYRKAVNAEFVNQAKFGEEQYKQGEETGRTKLTQQGENSRESQREKAAANLAVTKGEAGAQRKDIAAHDKAYVAPAESTEQSYKMMDSAYKEFQAAKAQGKTLPTGAQSMMALSSHLATTFGNVKGARITKDMIHEHLGARSISDSAKVAIQRLTNGDVLSPDQWEAFHDIIGESRRLKWETAVKEANRKKIPVDFLPSDLNGLAAPSGAESEVLDAGGKLIGHIVNNKYVPIGK